ncbi:translational GTPase TypA [Patescibacteria group bacterium]|nr:translational GTPase TypA [Patescibacteria group bacterium]MBU3999859.1 translational GTPase TypA [Patescibacteria group bacterium]MBU4057219.1 translational GTPase TypA [Patescibacteria group bacterium]
METKATQPNIRNVAIIAHVDHGKTTLVDALLKQTGVFRAGQKVAECVMDSNELERERGITIFSKNAAIEYKGVKINIIDTPGHADFSSEVERVLKMAEGVLLLVDAAEGPLAQTRFVLQKALDLGLIPIVVINKIDRKDARPKETLDLIYELFIDLGANEKQLEFPVIYAIAREGVAKLSLKDESKNLIPLLDKLLDYIPAPNVDASGPLQIMITGLDYSDFIGRLAIGKIERGEVKSGEKIALINFKGEIKNYSVTKLFTFDKLGKVETNRLSAGDLVALAGIPDAQIGDTIASAEKPEALPRVGVEEPTISMNFSVNDGPFAGKEGKFVTSRRIKERLFKELESNVGLRVEETDSASPVRNAISNGASAFKVSGRGVLHLGILVERMRREGYELALSKPQVIYREKDGEVMEPMEELHINVLDADAGKVIEAVGRRRGEMQNMKSHLGHTDLNFSISSRGLIGFRSEFIMLTRGAGTLDHRFVGYGATKGEIPFRINGVMVSMASGKVLAYALDNLQMRGKLFVKPGDEVYEGMIVGLRPEAGDLAVNPCKAKHVTNVRKSGGEEAIVLTPPEEMTLEKAIEFIDEDELVEVTPESVRLRKKLLKDNERRRKEKA